METNAYTNPPESHPCVPVPVVRETFGVVFDSDPTRRSYGTVCALNPARQELQDRGYI